MENKKYKKVSFPKFWRPAGFGNLPLSESLIKEEKHPCFIEQVEDPRQKPSGMTDFCYNGNDEIPDQVRDDNKWWNSGFTLIELLVVVLIIGILAAVAVPQYEQAVMKSRYATLKSNVKSIYEAQQLYFLANGKYAEDFEELSIDLAGCTLSEDKTQCIYPWGKCHFASGNGGSVGRGVCQNTTTLRNAYVRHWKGGKSAQTCWAFTEDPTDKYGKLCEREGGVYDGSSTCTHAFGSVCQIYPITK